MTLHCVGHSHLRAIVDGAAARGLPLSPHSLRTPDKEGKKPLPIVIRETVAALKRDRPDYVLCFIGGGTTAILGLPQHPVRFDFRLPWRSDLPTDPDAQVIPYDAMRAHLGQVLEPLLGMLAFFKRARIPLFQFETPPPIFENAAIAEIFRTLRRKTLVKPAAAHPNALSSPWLRYKIWALHSMVYEEFCRTNGIIYVKNPKAVVTESGFLAPGFWSDFVHGNAAYGAAVLENFIAHHPHEHGAPALKLR